MGIQEKLSSALLAGRRDAIIAADAEGVIRFWNPGAERQLIAWRRPAAASLARVTSQIAASGWRERRVLAHNATSLRCRGSVRKMRCFCRAAKRCRAKC